MNLQLDTRRDGDSVVVGVHGEIDNFTAPQLRQALVSAFDDGAHLVVVDLSSTDFLDSSALGALVGVLKQHEDTGKGLVVVCPKPHLRKIFHISHLDEVLHVYDGVEAALSAEGKSV